MACIAFAQFRGIELIHFLSFFVFLFFCIFYWTCIGFLNLLSLEVLQLGKYNNTPE